MALAERIDPLGSFRFLVEIDGITVAGFSEVSGLQVEVETEDYNEGGVNDSTHRLPKTARYPNLTLRRGVADSTALWEWQRDVARGMVQPRNIHIVLLDDLRAERWRWRCLNAYPVGWTGPELRASESSVAVESLELVHVGLERY